MESKEAPADDSMDMRSSDVSRSSVNTSMRGSERTSTRSSMKPPSVLVCDQADIKGSVSFGDGCVVHPGAQIDAKGGKITFGECCIIEEKVKIINKVRVDAQGQPTPKEMHIGSYNIFEAASVVSSSEIGDMNEFNNKAFVEDNCKIGNLCTIGPKVTLPSGTKLNHNSTVYEDSRIMINEELTAEMRKPKIKELSQILAMQLFRQQNKNKKA